MTSYAEFLAAKTSRIELPGRIVAAGDVHPSLHPWQNELVQWAVRTSRAALWADTGMVELRCGASELHLRNLWDRVPNVARTSTAWSRKVLLENVRRYSQTQRIDAALCDVRHPVLSASRRAGRWREGQPVLLAPLLRRVACGEHESRQLPEVRPASPAPHCGRIGTQPEVVTGRGCASHRPEQAQFRAVQFGSVPGPVAPRALPCGWYVR